MSEDIIFVIEYVLDFVKFHILLDDDIYDSKEEYISKRLEIDAAYCIWFSCTTNMKINRDKAPIGTNCDKKLIHIVDQGTCNPRIDIYEFDSSLDWMDDAIYTNILKYTDSYDDVIVTAGIK